MVINVNPINDAPELTFIESQSGIEDSEFSLELFASDVENDLIIYSASTDGNSQISIDENIKYYLYSGRVLGCDENIIVELKTSIRKNTDDLINSFPFQRIRFSKYSNAFERI